MPLNAVVADDDERFRAAVVASLVADGRIDPVAAVADGTAALNAVRRHRPDVLLLDLRMPGGGVELVRAATREAVVVVVSADLGTANVVEVLRAGARGALAKGSLADLLPEFVARCCAGEVVLAAPAAHRALARIADLASPS